MAADPRRPRKPRQQRLKLSEASSDAVPEPAVDMQEDDVRAGGVALPQPAPPAAPAPPAIGEILLTVIRQERQAKDALRPQGRTHLYISEVGTVEGASACHRRLWLDVHGASKDVLEPDTLLQFEYGDALGWRVANCLAKGDRVEKIELPLSFAGYPVSGRLDVLLRDGWVVECKTTTLKARNYVPKPDHMGQANLYAHALTQQGHRIHGSIVFYAFRDPAKGQVTSLEFPQPYDPIAAQATLEAFRTAWRVATGKAIPNRPKGFSPSGFPCSYCVLRTACWSRPDPAPEDEEVPF